MNNQTWGSPCVHATVLRAVGSAKGSNSVAHMCAEGLCVWLGRQDTHTGKSGLQPRQLASRAK